MRRSFAAANLCRQSQPQSDLQRSVLAIPKHDRLDAAAAGSKLDPFGSIHRDEMRSIPGREHLEDRSRIEDGFFDPEHLSSERSEKLGAGLRRDRIGAGPKHRLGPEHADP